MKLNGWTVKSVVGGAIGVASYFGTEAGLNAISAVFTIIKETHDAVIVVRGEQTAIRSEIEAIQRQLAGERITGRFVKLEDKVDKIDERLRAVEKEQSRRTLYFRR